MHKDICLNMNADSIFIRRWDPEEVTDGVPLMLLHDSLGCVELWRDFPAALAEHLGRTVYAYDRLGFGRSSLRENLPGTNFICVEVEEIIPAVADGLGLTEAIIFGHSVGGGWHSQLRPGWAIGVRLSFPSQLKRSSKSEPLAESAMHERNLKSQNSLSG